MAACSGLPTDTESDGLTAEQASAVSTSTPVGLALSVDNGTGQPLRVRAGQTFYLNQLDIRAAIPASRDEGVAGLAHAGDFAGLNWAGLQFDESDVAQLQNNDGTFSRRRYYTGAVWMKKKSSFTLEQLDGTGAVVGHGVTVDIGRANKDGTGDFFTRRLRAIQWTNDCVSPSDCTGASNFVEEALVEVRNTLDNTRTFTIHPSATALRLTWSLHGDTPYLIPLTQVAAPAYDYGFSIDIDPLTPPAPDGTYAPGSDITFQATLRDGSGNRLHPAGSLPSYFDVELGGGNPAGIQYYTAFFDPTIVYYRRKHRERMMMAQIVGPAQDIQPIRTILSIPDLLDPSGVQQAGLLERDGVFSEYVVFPRLDGLLGGAFDPAHTAWFAPVSDTWTYHIPSNAAPGTYLVTMKARRVYLGQDIPFTRTIHIQVGSPTPTSAPVRVGGCDKCHSGPTAVGNLLHGNGNLSACAGCHTPHAVEYDNPTYIRLHFVHSRSGRYDVPLNDCSQCHQTAKSIQRTSKSACLSCHTTYSQSHVDQFGPITSPFVGGGPESLDQCTSTCHITHPGSRLGAL